MQIHRADNLLLMPSHCSHSSRRKSSLPGLPWPLYHGYYRFLHISLQYPSTFRLEPYSRVQPRTSSYTITRVLIAISGTRRRRQISASAQSHGTSLVVALPTPHHLRHRGATPPSAPDCPTKTGSSTYFSSASAHSRSDSQSSPSRLPYHCSPQTPARTVAYCPNQLYPHPNNQQSRRLGSRACNGPDVIGTRRGEDLLRARKRSSDRMAMALTRRMETVNPGGLVRDWSSVERRVAGTVEEVPEAEEHHLAPVLLSRLNLRQAALRTK